MEIAKRRAMGTNPSQLNKMAGSTGLEPAASGLTGQRSNQLNYDPAKSRVLFHPKCRQSVNREVPSVRALPPPMGRKLQRLAKSCKAFSARPGG
jgi:hypothetical protein